MSPKEVFWKGYEQGCAATLADVIAHAKALRGTWISPGINLLVSDLEKGLHAGAALRAEAIKKGGGK